MNMKQANVVRKTAQAGFTLIELIVVIVILGILAATALPKFANLGSDARIASLKAAGSSLIATSAMAHGKYLLTPGATVAAENVNIVMSTTSGYPSDSATLVQAAGLNQSANSPDYVVIQPGSGAGTNNPATTASQIALIPNSVQGTPTGATCYVIYNIATTANSTPTLTYPTVANFIC